jgi:hypothetical protein
MGNVLVEEWMDKQLDSSNITWETEACPIRNIMIHDQSETITQIGNGE